MTAPARPTATVTGLGLVTPLGCEIDGFFEALCEARSGLVRPPEDHPVAGILEVAGMAPTIDPKTVLPPPDTRCLDPFITMGVAAADAALADAGIEVGRDVDPLRTAVVVANSTGGMLTFEAQVLARAERGRTAVSPSLLPAMLPNMAGARIAIKHGIRGFSSTIATACASSAYAVAEALRLIREGVADVVVCGGADAPLLPTTATAFLNARALAYGWDDPTEASRPFDRRRNGFVLSEGAGVMVVERTEHADARNAAGYADLLGWGVSTDAFHATMPRTDGEGAADAMRLALADARLAPGDVGYVNAHGTSTKRGDAAEAQAIRTVFGEDGPAVSSTKGVTGHLLASIGVVEAAATALSLSRGLLPPTHNLVDPDCELDHIAKAPREETVDAAVSNSFAFGGHNVSLVLGRPGTRAVRAGSSR
ncbi:MAG: beta-ketoacyl-[acyl-carrier-protein] synthase family protein [Actinocatenispora sp.]